MGSARYAPSLGMPKTLTRGSRTTFSTSTCSGGMSSGSFSSGTSSPSCRCTYRRQHSSGGANVCRMIVHRHSAIPPLVRTVKRWYIHNKFIVGEKGAVKRWYTNTTTISLNAEQNTNGNGRKCKVTTVLLPLCAERQSAPFRRYIPKRRFLWKTSTGAAVQRYVITKAHWRVESKPAQHGGVMHTSSNTGSAGGGCSVFFHKSNVTPSSFASPSSGSSPSFKPLSS